MEKIRTKVDIKYLGLRAIIEEDLTSKATNESYVYKVSCNDGKYILKGVKIEFGSEISMKNIIEVYKKYYLLKAACTSNIHFAKPLCIDYEVDLTQNQYIEILFEDVGITLEKLYYSTEFVNLEQTYDLMNQSINVLPLLNNIDDYYIRPIDMFYKEDTLKIINIEYNSALANRLIPQKIHNSIVYSWAISFCSLIFKRGYDELMCNAGLIEEGFSSLNTSYTKEKVNVIKNIIYKALNCGRSENIVKELTRLLEHNIKTCGNCSKYILKRAELTCKHMICKECLIEYALRKFIYKKSYKYSFLCSRCNHVRRLKNLELDCGCVVRQFEDNKELNYKTCENNHSLSIEDLNLTHDYSSFELTAKMLNTNKNSDLLMIFNKMVKDDDIAWTLENTTLIKKLNLSSKELGDEGTIVICEALRNNITLIKLNLEHNNIKCIEVLGELLKSNNTLRSLNVGYNFIGDEGAEIIGEALKFNKVLIYLQIMSNDIGDIRELSESLKVNETLAELDLCYNNIEDIEIMSEALKINKTLTKLRMKNNAIGCKGALMISEALEVNETLILLDIAHNYIRDYDAIDKMLKVNRTLTHLDLTFNDLNRIKTMSDAIRTNKTLKQLDIGYGNSSYACELIKGLKVNKTLIGLNLECSDSREDHIAKNISNVLSINKDLARLNIGNNDIMTEGIRLISEVLRKSKTLKELNIKKSHIKIEGLKLISEALKVNKSLTLLDISGCSITDIRMMSEGLKVNKTLTELNLEYNKIEDVEGIVEILKSNTILKVLNLGNNFIGSKGAEIIARAFNKTLKQLNLEWNNIEDIEAIGEMLKSNKTLTHLNLSSNNIKYKGAEVISEALKFNKILNYLNMECNYISNEGRQLLNEAYEQRGNLLIIY